MIRHGFTQAMQQLEDDLLSLGAAVEKQIESSVEALKRRDFHKAADIAAKDSEIDELRYGIEEQCVELFATQSPVASDLRKVTAALIIANELERMGDYAEGICKLTIKMAGEPPLKPLIDIPRMSQLAQSMLRRALEAFTNRDLNLAKEVWQEDDQLDELYQQILRELLSYMLEDPSSITRATYLLWVAHNLERMGDRVSNIAERIVYMVTGEINGSHIRTAPQAATRG